MGINLTTLIRGFSIADMASKALSGTNSKIPSNIAGFSIPKIDIEGLAKNGLKGIDADISKVIDTDSINKTIQSSIGDATASMNEGIDPALQGNIPDFQSELQALLSDFTVE